MRVKKRQNHCYKILNTDDGDNNNNNNNYYK